MSDNDDFSRDPGWIVLADGAGLVASVQPEAAELATMMAGIPGPGPGNPGNAPVESPPGPEQRPDESPEEHPDSVPPDDPDAPPGEGPTLEP